jgi:hypothetical protein
MTPHANALTVMADIGVRAAICLATGRACDTTDATCLRAARRHTGGRHAGRRQAGRRQAGRRHAGRCNVGTRHAGRCQARSRHEGRRKAGRDNAGRRNVGRCNVGGRHAGRCHRGRRKTRTADTADAHEATANRTTRRDAAIRTANKRTSDAIVRTTKRRPGVATARAGRTGTAFWISDGAFWISEGNNPSGSSGDSGASVRKSLSGGNGIRGGARGIAQVAPSRLFQVA